jgi:hypothetical protein
VQAKNQQPPVKVVWIYDVPNGGRLKAMCRVRVWELTIDEIKILESIEPGVYWAALPQRPTRKDGSGWRSVLEFDPGVWPHVRNAILDAFAEHQRAGGKQ